jgi:adenylate cyclase
LTEPGSIIVSRTVYNHVRGKVRLGFDDLGERQLKNIAEPVRIYRLRPDGEGVITRPALALPNKPSIVVLPLTNMSGDLEQRYLSDGITEDIITALSRFHSLFVIAHNSSFQYREKAVDVRRVAQELGVQYVAEGSVRKAGTNIRIAAQLIDAPTGKHLWAERYEGGLQDIFAFQEEAARTIAATLEGRVAASGAEQARRKPTEAWAAYDCLLQGRARNAAFDEVGAEVLFARAIELDPGYTHAHAWRAVALSSQYWQDQQLDKLRHAEACARAAVSLDDHDALSHWAMAYVSLRQRKFDFAGVHFDRARSLNPNDVLIAADHANWLTRMGRPSEALEGLDEVMRRDPFPPTWVWGFRFSALFHLKRYEEAIVALRNMATLHSWHYAYFAAAYAHVGQLDDAYRELATFLEIEPRASLALVAAAEPYFDHALREHFLEGLRKAGLPE